MQISSDTRHHIQSDIQWGFANDLSIAERQQQLLFPSATGTRRGSATSADDVQPTDAPWILSSTTTASSAS